MSLIDDMEFGNPSVVWILDLTPGEAFNLKIPVLRVTNPYPNH